MARQAVCKEMSAGQNSTKDLSEDIPQAVTTVALQIRTVQSGSQLYTIKDIFYSAQIDSLFKLKLL